MSTQDDMDICTILNNAASDIYSGVSKLQKYTEVYILLIGLIMACKALAQILCDLFS